MSAPPPLLAPRHIQNFSEAAELEPHWGYAMRALPCTSDPGSCAYLDVVYGSHDRGVAYLGVFWLLVLALALAVGVARRASGGVSVSPPTASPLRRLASLLRRDAPLPALFGRGTSWLQLAVLALLAAYLLVFSFVGIAYATWVTPVKAHPGVYNTRTSLGPWSDRVGLLAFGLLPLSVLLGSRESVLSLLTALPHHRFLFLHRWVGHIVLAQSALHAVGWCVVELNLYRPQPKVGREWIRQRYMVWGVVALALLSLLWLLATPFAIRRTGYEAFRKAHYVLAVVFIGACWGHWEQLKAFLIASLAVWALDRAARLGRSALLHRGFRAWRADATLFDDGDVVRLDVVDDGARGGGWRAGQHFYVTFADLGAGSLWQAHPLTPLDAPDVGGGHRHAYVFRAKSGETRRVADAVASRRGLVAVDGGGGGGDEEEEARISLPRLRHQEPPAAEADSASASSQLAVGVDGGAKDDAGRAATTATKTTTRTAEAVRLRVILCGPYGESTWEKVRRVLLTPTVVVPTAAATTAGGAEADEYDTRVVCVAGGTGVTFVLPVLLQLARHSARLVASSTAAAAAAAEQPPQPSSSSPPQPPPPRRPRLRAVLHWVVRHARDAEWVREELAELRRSCASDCHGGGGGVVVEVRMHATRDAACAADGAGEGGGGEAEKGDARADAADDVEKLPSSARRQRRRPDVGELLRRELLEPAGGDQRAVASPSAAVVIASGPVGMTRDVRRAVSELELDSGRPVSLVTDDRQEWF